MTKSIWTLISGAWLLGASAGTHRLIASSGPEHVQLLELYSSESCSSCPPADQWIATLKNKTTLWKKVVPVVFHVDYWNDLGWKDGLSSNSMTKRQQDLARAWTSPSVYTPAFVVDGQEWRGWSSGEIPASGAFAAFKIEVYEEQSGDLTVTVRDRDGQAPTRPVIVRLATLGVGLSQRVTSGENAGKLLSHNFVVLDWEAHTLNPGELATAFHFTPSAKKPKATAVAAWIERPGNPVPLQAAGGNL